MSYVLAILVGILAFFAFSSRKQKAEDLKFQHEEAALDEAIKTKKAEAEKAQETADELTKKYQEELRDYGSDSSGNDSKPS
jgi:hypothetical protein